MLERDGCAILWNLPLKAAVKELKCNHVRLCGIMIQISNNCEFMCINEYLPCDGRSENDKFVEYMDALVDIQQLIHIYNPPCVIYGGDTNTDLARSTPHAYVLRNFILDFNLTVCIDVAEAEVACTYVSPNGFSSRIDSFIVIIALGQRVLDVLL